MDHSSKKVVFVFLPAIVMFMITGANAQFARSTRGNPMVPQYRFHYYVRDQKTGDYKSQEEHRNGDNVKGSYMVGEPNGDLRVVKYIADVANGFRANVSVQPGASPIKQQFGQEANVSYNNYRTGLAPNKSNHNPLRGFNPIVVQQLTQPQSVQVQSKYEYGQHPYPYYNNENSTVKQANKGEDLSLSITPPKSVEVELNYKDESELPVIKDPEQQISDPNNRDKNSEQGSTKFDVVSAGSSIVTNETNKADILSSSLVLNKTTTMATILSNDQNIAGEITSDRSITENSILEPTTNQKGYRPGTYQFGNLDIPTSILEIINRNKDNNRDKLQQNLSSNKESITTQATTTTIEQENETADNKNENFLNRPLRLMGLNPIFMDNLQLQSLTDKPSMYHQLHLEPFGNLQYMTPSPLFNGPLLGGPLFRNTPRSAQNSNDSYESFKSVPAPLVVPNLYPTQPQTDDKFEIKADKSLHLCSDCILTSAYMTYPALKTQQTTTNNNNKPCSNQANADYTNAIPYSYRPGFAFILMPPQIRRSQL